MPGLIFAQIQEEANKAHEMAVTSLEDNVRSLEQKCTDAEQNNINLKKEMEEVRELEKANLKKREQNCHKSTQTTLDSTHSGNDIVIGNDGKMLIGEGFNFGFLILLLKCKLPLLVRLGGTGNWFYVHIQIGFTAMKG